MAISFDNATAGSKTTGSPLTISHSNTAGNLAIVGVGVPVADAITGVTYNGVAMTLIGKQSSLESAGGRFEYMFYLLAPATGTSNVAITSTGTEAIYATVATYTGVLQTIPDNSTTLQAATGTSHTMSLTTVANNCWTFITGRTNLTQSAGTGSTARGANNPDGGPNLYDSNGPVTPAGSKSMTITTASNSFFGGIMASFAPIVAAASGSTLPMMGV